MTNDIVLKMHLIIAIQKDFEKFCKIFPGTEIVQTFVHGLMFNKETNIILANQETGQQLIKESIEMIKAINNYFSLLGDVETTFNKSFCEIKNLGKIIHITNSNYIRGITFDHVYCLKHESDLVKTCMVKPVKDNLYKSIRRD